jgi:lysophospholipase L1-like esterase
MAPGRAVLIIGDSISMGYTPQVAELLAGRAEVVHNPGNAGDTDNTAAHLDAWLKEIPAEVIHFNCGLHDIKRSRQAPGRQVPLQRYRANLGRIVERLKRSGAKLIWAASTPVIEERHRAAKDFDRGNGDVDAYNAAAAEIMAGAGIPVNDLHAAVAAAGAEEVICDDGVHLTDGGYRMLAEVVADRLRTFL